MTRIHALTPFTMLDYPGEMACILWLAKCNFRCVYCHNPDIVFGQGTVEEETFRAFLDKRRGQLTAVVFSGGEATLCPDLPVYAAWAKERGYKVKLDTNGTVPQLVKDMIEQGLIDSIALDYKAPDAKMAAIVGTDHFIKEWGQTLDLGIASQRAGRIVFEVRTTYHSGLMDEGDLNAQIHRLEKSGYTGTYYIQNIISTGEDTLGGVEKPVSELDVALLQKPQGFSLGFRNFKHIKQPASGA